MEKNNNSNLPKPLHEGFEKAQTKPMKDTQPPPPPPPPVAPQKEDSGGNK